MKKSLFDQETYDDVLARLNKINADTKPQWGAMDAAKMMAHCAEIQEVGNGKPLEGTPWYVKLFKGFIRKSVVNDTPYPKSSQTHPQYKQNSTKDFEQEKTRLLEALEKFKNKSPEDISSYRHALFGAMTKEEQGWGMYKHIDHHLSQFGV